MVLDADTTYAVRVLFTLLLWLDHSVTAHLSDPEITYDFTTSMFGRLVSISHLRPTFGVSANNSFDQKFDETRLGRHPFLGGARQEPPDVVRGTGRRGCPAQRSTHCCLTFYARDASSALSTASETPHVNTPAVCSWS